MVLSCEIAANSDFPADKVSNNDEDDQHITEFNIEEEFSGKVEHDEAMPDAKNVRRQ